jgi:hypothetical protein
VAEYNRLGGTQENWYCFNCLLPPFSDSFFSQQSGGNDSFSSVTSVASNDEAEEECNPIAACSELRQKYPKNALLCHLNINSLRHKVHDLKPFMHRLQPVLMAIAETKLDDSFPNAQFIIEDYHPPIRHDRNAHGGGLMAYVRTDIPCRQLHQLKSNHVESLFLELFIKKDPWLIGIIYRPPSLSDQLFMDDMEMLMDSATSLHQNILLLGDMNYDCMVPTKCRPLKTIMEEYALDNVIKKPTFLSQHGASLIDVGLTNCRNRFAEAQTTDIGLSDGHLMITAPLKTHLPRLPAKKITYRSFKEFSPEQYASDVAHIPFAVAEIFDDPSDIQWIQNKLITEILDDHAPLKKKTIRATQPPFLNTKLRKAIFNKTRLRHKLEQGKCRWEDYRKQRNATTAIRRKSIKTYFKERCNGGPKRQNFWRTVKPLTSNTTKTGNNITLKNGNDLITEHHVVAELFNEHFTHIADDIGANAGPLSTDYDKTMDFVKASNEAHTEHPSVIRIRERNRETFNFDKVSSNVVEKTINDLDKKKPAGHDTIPAKALKDASHELGPPLAFLYNQCVMTGTFPDDCKRATITPVLKKGDPLQTTNYRPVSILSSTSKILEKCMELQMKDFLESIWDPCLSAFRQGYSCQQVLIHVCETWRAAIEKHETAGMLLIDLSKAFDCLPQSLTIAKLSAYGLSEKHSYTSHNPMPIQNCSSAVRPMFNIYKNFKISL